MFLVLNFKTGAAFARRLLELGPKPEVTAQVLFIVSTVDPQLSDPLCTFHLKCLDNLNLWLAYSCFAGLYWDSIVGSSKLKQFIYSLS